MSRRLIAAGLLAVGIWWVFGRRRVRAQGPVDVVGSSSAVGLAGPLKQALGPTLGVVRGWGVSGSIAGLWVTRIDTVLAAKPPPATVIVALGPNDSVSADALAKFPARIQTIVSKIRSVGAQPILLVLPAQLPNMPKIIAALYATGEVVLTPPPNMPLALDKIHATAQGYRDWAAKIAHDVT